MAVSFDNSNAPERLREIIVLLQLGQARLKVEYPAIDVNPIVAQALDSALGVVFGGILALEDLFNIDSGHACRYH